MKWRLQGTGPTILFLHGIPTSGHLWDYVAEVLQRDFSCLMVDLPGLGESPPLADDCHDPARYAEAVEALREQLHVQSWHVVGHDAGSTVAVHYADQFAERVNRLVLCSPPVFPDFRVPWFFRLIRVPLVGDFFAPFVTFLMWRFGIQLAIDRHDHLTDPIIQSFHRPFAGYRGVRRFVHILRWGDPKQVLARTAAALPKITMPTLILHGKADRAIPQSFAVRVAALIPNSEMHILDCGHFLPLDCPDALCQYLLSFLSKEV